MQTASSACSSCALPVLAEFYFCPNCGKQLRPKPLTISLGKQIGVYLLSFFLPPLGLYPAIKYLRQPNKKTKIIGVVAIVLTIFSIAISLYSFMQLMQQLSQQLNQLSPQSF
jgi:hypothetical protein